MVARALPQSPPTLGMPGFNRASRIDIGWKTYLL
jgi:hypothetical protein